MKVFESKRFQRFHFGAAFEATFKSSHRNEDERRREEVSAYHKYKNDKRVVATDDCVYYYLVFSKWMESWRKFANGER